MYKSIFLIICFAYKTIIRPVLLKSVSDSETDFDDWALSILDKLFSYMEN